MKKSLSLSVIISLAEYVRHIQSYMYNNNTLRLKSLRDPSSSLTVPVSMVWADIVLVWADNAASDSPLIIRNHTHHRSIVQTF